MYTKIPFEKEIEFNTSIAEITNISLEHDYNINDGVVLGNFYVEGEYKSHSISVNTEKFKYTLPFTVEIGKNIKEDTLEFNIEDFNYEIDNTILKVKIDYSLKAEEKELFQKVDESELKNELSYIDSFLERDDLNEEKNQDNRESQEEVEQVQRHDEQIGLNEENAIINSIENYSDNFITYHAHIVKDGETLESISAIYKVSKETLVEYNSANSLNPGDKVLIPDFNE